MRGRTVTLPITLPVVLCDLAEPVVSWHSWQFPFLVFKFHGRPHRGSSTTVLVLQKSELAPEGSNRALGPHEGKIGPTLATGSLENCGETGSLHGGNGPNLILWLVFGVLHVVPLLSWSLTCCFHGLLDPLWGLVGPLWGSLNSVTRARAMPQSGMTWTVMEQWVPMDAKDAHGSNR